MAPSLVKSEHGKRKPYWQWTEDEKIIEDYPRGGKMKILKIVEKDY